MAGFIIGDPPESRAEYLEMIPPAYHQALDADFLNDELGCKASLVEEFDDLEVIPYLDCRFAIIRNPDLGKFRREGFRGLKMLYIPNDDPELAMEGWKRFFAGSESAYQDTVIQTIEQAISFGWPVVFHANAKRDEGFLKELLQTAKGHPFIIPHFGFSRRIIAQIMERFDHCHTDFSSLLPFMQENPRGYLDFITVFQDRILFGSDALFDEPQLIADYLAFATDLVADKNVLEKILVKNYVRVHQ
jgi:hypothetical protein